MNQGVNSDKMENDQALVVKSPFGIEVIWHKEQNLIQKCMTLGIYLIIKLTWM